MLFMSVRIYGVCPAISRPAGCLTFFGGLKIMAKISPIQFFRQVKQEVKKVTWPTKDEVVKTSIMVLIIVAIAATFFFFVDQILGWAMKLILGLGV